MNRLGSASFSFYLIHAPIIRAVRGMYLYFGREVHSWTVFAAITMVGLVGVQVLAFTIYGFYERPLQIWLRSLVRRDGLVFAGNYVPAHAIDHCEAR